MARISLITAGKPHGYCIRKLESPRHRSRSVFISSIAGRRKVSDLNRRLFCQTWLWLCDCVRSRHATRTFVQNAPHAAGKFERQRSGERDKWYRKRSRKWERRRESRTTNDRLYGRTLIQSLIEISIWGVNAPRNDTMYFVHNSP